MKKISLFLVAALCSLAQVCAQNVGIGTKNPQQKLHVAGGLRVDTLSNGKDSGLLRHNADGTVFSLAFSGDSTQVLRGNGTFGSAATATVIPFGLVTDPWLLGGNAGVTPATNFLGTTDNAALRLRINNQWAGQLDSVSQSSFFGYGAGKNDTAAAAGNTAIGYLALNGTTGSFNTAAGVRALRSNTTGNYNTAMGWQALITNTTGVQNTALGVQALQSNTTGGNNTAVGLNSMNVNSTGTDNSAVGVQALNFNTSGNFNTAIGRSALFANSTGNGNVAAGHQALGGNTTGFSNVAIGVSALTATQFTSNMVAIGDSAMFSFNPTPGGKPIDGNIGWNTAVGSKALFSNVFAHQNTAVGAYALYLVTAPGNTGVGADALAGTTTGQDNTVVGSGALSQANTGSNNVAVGVDALITNRSGNNNTALGFEADLAVDGLTNATAIGNGALVTASNTIQLGNSSVVNINYFGTLHAVSDGRFKFNIKDDVKGLDFILRLRPVSYQLDARKLDPKNYAAQASYDEAMTLRRTGFIAQEVEKAAQNCGYPFTGVMRPQNEQDHYSLDYQAFIMPMVKAIQEQQQQIDELKKTVAEQRRMIDELIHHQ